MRNQMQSYHKNQKNSNIRQISGYAWLILIVNQDEIGTRLDLSKTYVKHIPMFREYLCLQDNGYKKTYIYHYLGGRYNMHPDSVKRVITKLQRVVEL